ncbi:hypothetical protein K2X89_15595 [Myxococcota bacterium]|nr:hypothetical protein [Myxococcota bacterium]
MPRRFRDRILAFGACLAIVLAAASASAVVSFDVIRTFVPSGNPLHDLAIGDLITIDIRMSNPTGATLYGIGAGVQGWNNGVLTFQSAEMNEGPYFCATAACTTGLSNSLSFPFDEPTGIFRASANDVQNIAGVGS